uniref:Uncharacterized protein n=1 Tax=Noccaea caerulescens TaxID=107243 RepID=A0A1J3EFW0_NOCCA
MKLLKRVSGIKQSLLRAQDKMHQNGLENLHKKEKKTDLSNPEKASSQDKIDVGVSSCNIYLEQDKPPTIYMGLFGKRKYSDLTLNQLHNVSSRGPIRDWKVKAPYVKYLSKPLMLPNES